jgi:hypothetical protein
MKTITITQKELSKAYGDEITGYCDIAEDLGICAGVGGYQEENWYFDNIADSLGYTVNEYDFESDMLNMEEETFLTLCKKLDVVELVSDEKIKTASKTALDKAEEWDRIVEDVREKATPYYDSEISSFFPDFVKECEKAEEYAQKEMRSDFVSGDYHGNFEGIERKLEKLLDAEEVDVKDFDSVSISWDDVVLLEKIDDYFGKKDLRLAKKYALTTLVDNARHYKNKEKAEREARRAEYEKTKAYQDERRKKEEEARRARLLSFTK